MRAGSGVCLPPIGAKVRHPLWPELGVGEVQSTNKAAIGSDARGRGAATYATGRVRWSTGQVSVHNLAILRELPS